MYKLRWKTERNIMSIIGKYYNWERYLLRMLRMREAVKFPGGELQQDDKDQPFENKDNVWIVANLLTQREQKSACVCVFNLRRLIIFFVSTNGSDRLL